MSLVVFATPMSSCSEESDDDRMSTAAVADEVEYNAAAAPPPMLVEEAVATDVVVVVVVVVVAASPNRANAAFAANSLTDKLSLFDNVALPTLVRLSTIFDPLSNGRFFGMLLVYPEL
jgi:hypothetical protein